MGLATVEFLSCYEVLQVLVVHPDLYRVSGSFQEMPLSFQCMRATGVEYSRRFLR